MNKGQGAPSTTSSFISTELSQKEKESVPAPKKRNIRHAEKRRTSTCLFADRVAQVSIDHYKRVIPENERLPQTCLATIVAYVKNIEDGGTSVGHDNLVVMGMGVGTKFLGQSILEDETASDNYGHRVRDCHAEVLARRAFRRQLTLEILDDLQRRQIGTQVQHREQDETLSCNSAQSKRDSILMPFSSSTGILTGYRLRPGVTLHMYSSSTPCGNAALKKFAKMSREKFRDDLGHDEWPTECHEPIHGSSIQLGQFSLLIKMDSSPGSNHDMNMQQIKSPLNCSMSPSTASAQLHTNSENGMSTGYPQKNREASGKIWPALKSDDWTPPGTTIIQFSPRKGSIHTCSDKIARWNYLGLQGSLLSSLLEGPLYPATLTVGRKFTSCICRRATCCRIESDSKFFQRKEKELDHSFTAFAARANHPALLGTAIYMDETGVVETSPDIYGQDVRFHSSRSWSWWPWLEHDSLRKDNENFFHREPSPAFCECIDGTTGYLMTLEESKLNQEVLDTQETLTATYERQNSSLTRPSRLCTASLTQLFMETYSILSSLQSCESYQCSGMEESIEDDQRGDKSMPFSKFSEKQHNSTLADLRGLKQRVAPAYEAAKEELLTQHRIFRHWQRRCSIIQ